MANDLSRVNAATTLRNYLVNLRDSIVHSYSDIWPLTVEHVLCRCERYIEQLDGCDFPTYRYLLFLHEMGVCRNSFTLADSLRYMCVDDYAVDAVLINQMVASLQQPVFQRYASICDPRANVRADDIDIEMNQKKLVQSLVRTQLDCFWLPSQYGNAAVREALVLLHEDLIAACFPGLFGALRWHYREFLAEKKIVGSFCRVLWENEARFFELEPAFQEFFREYLTRLVVAISGSAELPLDSLHRTYAETCSKWASLPGTRSQV